jgi:tRNA modification GTPase
MGTLAHMEAMIDFVEDDIPSQADNAMLGSLEEARAAIDELLEGTEQGIVLREGATLAIAGSPNVGKSSIMNALLGLERSIVTPVAGTTRDTIEETLQVRGVPFRTVDTAGITETDDLVEQIGVERSRRALEAADVILLVLDRSRPFSPGDELALQAVDAVRAAHEDNGRQQRVVLALNKADLPARLDPEPAIRRIAPARVVESSSLDTGGIDPLREALAYAALGGPRHEHVVGNVRHQAALRRAGNALQTALEGIREGMPLDLVSFDVRASAQALGEITGTDVDEELLDRIFRDFCIGK